MIRIKLLILIFLFVSCDSFSPQKCFKIAVPLSDYSYTHSAKHLEQFLNNGGFNITIVNAENAVDANNMVANGDADLTFIMNHSTFIPSEVEKSRNLRSILPLFTRLFFLFSKEPVSDNERNILSGKSIGIEVLGGETHYNLSKILNSGKLNDVEIVSRDDSPDFIHFWGTYYGQRATMLLNDGWKEVSLSQDWIDYITLNDPAVSPFVLPAIPGLENSENLHTFSVETLLVGRADLGEKAVYQLSEYIFQHKLELIGYDNFYRSINESFDHSALLYATHVGTDQYLRRDEPTFFERYAEVIALLLSIIAIVYGAVQGIRNRLSKQKKERIDLYFLEFLDIRTHTADKQERIRKLDSLLQRALEQMTNEKLDKTDFHIFARIVQQELVFIK